MSGGTGVAYGILRCLALITTGVLVPIGFVSEPAGAAQKSAWVKVCDKTGFVEGNRTAPKAVCLTHHERIDANTGLVLVSAAIRQIEGEPLPNLMVMVPTGMALQAGVQVKIDGDNQVHKLKYTLCHPAGCAAEAQASPALIKIMQSAKQMIIATMNPNGRAVGFPVPLTGFGKAYKGKAMDSKRYAAARKNLLALVRKRQAKAKPKNKRQGSD